MFGGISLGKTAPIYEQLVEKIENMVLSGVLEPDEPLPSVRELAADLAVNPNTIQKAYSELERRGVTYSVIGKGRFVSSDKEPILKRKTKAALAGARAAAEELLKLGYKKEELMKMIDVVWGCKK